MRAAFLTFFAAFAAFAQTLTLVSGNGQVVAEQNRTQQPMVVRIADAVGNPVPNVPVTWTNVSANGTVSVQDPVTDAAGFSRANFVGTSLQLGISYLSSTITATSSYGSATFYTTTVLSRLSGGGLAPLPVAVVNTTYSVSGSAGSLVPDAVTVQVVATAGPDSGRPIPNVGLRLEPKDPTSTVTAVCDGPGGVVLTDVTGTARCNARLGSTPGTAQVIVSVGEFVKFPNAPLNVTVTPGAACTFTLNPLAQTVAASGGAGSFQVNSGPGCSWIASTTAPWITITSGGSGTGNGSVFFSAGANTGPQRSALISVGGQSFTITQNATGSSGGNTLAFAIAPTLPGATASSSYSVGLTAAGGTPPYQWSTAAALPPGLSLNAASGILGGVPTTQGVYSFPVTVRDAANAMVTQTFSLTVNPAVPQGSILITTTSFPTGSVGVPYQQAVAFSGGCQNPFSGQPAITLSSGALPTGLTLGAGGLSIAGTPTVAGLYNFSLRIADSCGASSTRSFSINVGGVPASEAMTANRTTLTFQAQAGSALPQPQTIAVATGSSALNFSASAQSNGGWLTVTPSQGTTPGSVIVSVSSLANLPPGAHTGSVTLVSQASNSPLTIPVTLNLSAPAPVSITVSPVQVNFAYTQGTTSIQEQTITLNSPASAEFRTSVVSSGGTWLAVSPISGTSPSLLRIVANSVGLAAGEYAGTVTIVPVANASATQAVQVRLTVSAPATLTVAPSTLSFSVAPGGVAPTAQTIAIGSSGGTVAYTATPNSSGWLSVNPASGSTPSNLAVSVNPAGLSAGSYQGSISIVPASTNIPVVVAVSLNVSSGGVQLSSVTNAASFAPGALSPGEIVTIFGTGLGPVSGVGLALTPEGTVATTLAATRVLFDGIAAPLVYVSATQISAIVPYSIAGRNSTRIEVEQNGVRSALTEVAVVASSPGIFTAGGTGQAAALNQDGAENSSQNPAESGSVIVLFATGEGQTTPGGQDGKITPLTGPYPAPLAGVAVSIGGQPAEVLYAGAAPGLAAGVLQVNARIPAGLRGNAPVVLTIGQNTSQSNAVISVR